MPYALRCRAVLARYPTALGNGLCPAGATPVWAPWWVEGARDEFQPINMASLTLTSLTTKQKNKEPDRNDNYYDRWFVIQGVDEDKPLSKMSPFAVVKALKCAVETQINKMPSQWGSAGGGWLGLSKSLTQQDKQPGWLSCHSQPSPHSEHLQRRHTLSRPD